MAARLHHRGSALAAVGVDRGNKRLVEPVFGDGLADDTQCGRIGAFGCMATAQDGGVARFEAQRGDIDRHIGPGLVNHADDADGHAYLVEAQPVGQVVPAHDLPDRIGQRGDMPDALRAGGDAVHVETQAVEFSFIHAGFEGFLHVLRVGGGDVVGMRVEGVGDGEQQLVLRFRVGLFERTLGPGGGVGHHAYGAEDLRVDAPGLPAVFLVRHSQNSSAHRGHRADFAHTAGQLFQRMTAAGRHGVLNGADEGVHIGERQRRMPMAPGRIPPIRST